MNRQRWLLLGLALSLAFNFAFLGAFGYRYWIKRKYREKWPHRIERIGPPFPQGPPGFKDRFEFRKEQMEKLHHIRKRFFPRLEKTWKDVFQKRMELTELITAEKPDTVQIDRLIDEIGKLQCRIEKEVVRQMLKEREVMSPEQREHFRKFIWNYLEGCKKNFPPPPDEKR